MKKFLIVTAALMLSLICPAQETAKVIYLNNGSHFECTVIGETSTTVTVQNTSGEKTTYDKIEVKMITDKPAPLPDTPDAKPYTDYSSLTKGFWGAVDLSGGYNIHANGGAGGSVPVELDIIAGYRFNKYIQLGIGAGVKFYCGGNDVWTKSNGKYTQQNFALPIFFNARGIMMDDRSRTTVPFWSASIGYTIYDGLMFSPAIGIRIGSLERHHFNIALAYTLQQAYITDTNKSLLPVQGFLNAVSLRLGYQF